MATTLRRPRLDDEVLDPLIDEDDGEVVYEAPEPPGFDEGPGYESALSRKAPDISRTAPSVITAPELSQEVMRPRPAYAQPEEPEEPPLGRVVRELTSPPTGEEDPYRRSKEQFPLRDVPIVGGVTNVLSKGSNVFAPRPGSTDLTDALGAIPGGGVVAPARAMGPVVRTAFELAGGTAVDVAGAAGRTAVRGARGVGEEVAPAVRRFAEEERGSVRLPGGGEDLPDDELARRLAEAQRLADENPMEGARSRQVEEPAPGARTETVAPESAGEGIPPASGVEGRVTPEEPSISRSPAGEAGLTEDPVEKLTRLVRAAAPASEETQALRSAELGKRVGRAAASLEQGQGREAFQRSKGALRGELPRAQFEPPEPGLTPEDVGSLFERVKDLNRPYLTKLRTAEGLETLLLGKVPTAGELGLLQDAFGPELVKAALSKRSRGQKTAEFVLDLANLPRATLASFDISFPLRQGALLIGHPKQWAGQWGPMFRALRSEDGMQAVEEAILTGPYAALREKAGVDFIRSGPGGAQAQRAEEFVSQWAEKIPGVSHSQRAFVTAGNWLRANVFDDVVRGWEHAGYKATDKDLADLAAFVNSATGRGNLGRLQELAPVLNAAFFSPRLLVSRFQVPAQLFTASPAVRKVIAKDLVAFTGTGLAVLGMMKFAGAQVEGDPRNSEFGTVRIGNSRWDFWAGYRPLARYTAQLITGQRATGGRVRDLDRWETIGRFLRSKLAPVPGEVVNQIAGSDFVGDELGGPLERAYSLFVPLFIQDLAEAVEENGIMGLALGAPAAIGVGVQSYHRDQEQVPGLDMYDSAVETMAAWLAQDDVNLGKLLREYGRADTRTDEGRRQRQELRQRLGEEKVAEFNRGVRQIREGLVGDHPELLEYLQQERGSRLNQGEPTPTRTPTRTPTPVPTATGTPQAQVYKPKGEPSHTRTPVGAFPDPPKRGQVPSEGYERQALADLLYKGPNGERLALNQLGTSARRFVLDVYNRADNLAKETYGRPYNHLSTAQKNDLLGRIGTVTGPPLHEEKVRTESQTYILNDVAQAVYDGAALNQIPASARSSLRDWYRRLDAEAMKRYGKEFADLPYRGQQQADLIGAVGNPPPVSPTPTRTPTVTPTPTPDYYRQAVGAGR